MPFTVQVLKYAAVPPLINPSFEVWLEFADYNTSLPLTYKSHSHFTFLFCTHMLSLENINFGPFTPLPGLPTAHQETSLRQSGYLDHYILKLFTLLEY